MWSIALKLIGPLFNWIKPMLAPLFAYFKGRSDGKRNAERKAERKDNAHIKKANDAGRDAAGSGKLSDNFFRD